MSWLYESIGEADGDSICLWNDGSFSSNDLNGGAAAAMGPRI
jgi:hypothetical protein